MLSLTGGSMTTTRTCTWRTARSANYPHTIVPFTGDLPDHPGNYILAKEVPSGWIPLYIGQTASLKRGLSHLFQHESYPCAIQNGATHIHFYVNQKGEASRRAIEQALVKRYQPDCNRRTNT